MFIMYIICIYYVYAQYLVCKYFIITVPGFVRIMADVDLGRYLNMTLLQWFERIHYIFATVYYVVYMLMCRLYMQK
jgi:hypothetical protein